jgi:tetratricopeptide (TPR) repeat protein
MNAVVSCSIIIATMVLTPQEYQLEEIHKAIANRQKSNALSICKENLTTNKGALLWFGQLATPEEIMKLSPAKVVTIVEELSLDNRMLHKVLALDKWIVTQSGLPKARIQEAQMRIVAVCDNSERAEQLQKLQELVPLAERSACFYGLSKLARSAGNYDLGIQVLSLIVDNPAYADRASMELDTLKVCQLFVHKASDEAIAKTEDFKAKYADSGSLNSRLMQISFRAMQHQAAYAASLLEFVIQTAKDKEEKRDALVRMSIVKRRLEDNEGALQALLEARPLHDSFGEIDERIMVLATKMGNLEVAAERLDEWLEIDVRELSSTASIAHYKNIKKVAYALYRDSLKRNSNEKALYYGEVTLSTFPANKKPASLLFSLAQIAEKVGNDTKAKALYKEFLAMAPLDDGRRKEAAAKS